MGDTAESRTAALFILAQENPGLKAFSRHIHFRGL